MNQETFAWPAHMRSNAVAPPEGWDAQDDAALEKAAADQSYAAEMAAFETAKLVHDVFGQGRGPELLEHLRDMTIEEPSFVMGGTVVPVDEQQQTFATLQPEQQGLIREGQNSIYRYFRDMLKQALNPPPTPAAAAPTEEKAQ